MTPLRKLSRLAWINLVYILPVILWGAFVRATGSGAGCGRHWPLCNGELIPRDPTVKTLIEWGHRLTSGLAVVLIVALLIVARRALPKGHLTRRWTEISVFLMIVEALLGAGLVLFRLVENDTSVLRAIAMSLHLVNTLLLVGAITLTAWFASGGRARAPGNPGALEGVLGLGVAGMLVLGASGALAALGSTLFPEAQGLATHLAPTAHFFLKLAVFHPMIALAVGSYLLIASAVVAWMRPSVANLIGAGAVSLLVLIQVAAGVLNIYLMAPVWLQLVHLLLADLLWIAWVLLCASSLATQARQAPAEEGVPAAA